MNVAEKGSVTDAMPVTAMPGVHEFMTAAPRRQARVSMLTNSSLWGMFNPSSWRRMIPMVTPARNEAFGQMEIQSPHPAVADLHGGEMGKTREGERGKLAVCRRASVDLGSKARIAGHYVRSCASLHD